MKQQERRKFPYGMFAGLLALDVAMYLLQKMASQRAGGAPSGFFLHLALEPWTWMALALGPMQLWIWTGILEHADISLAYPLTSLAYPLTLLCARFFLGEELHWQVWAGAFLITLGAAVMARTGRQMIVSELRGRERSGNV